MPWISDSNGRLLSQQQRKTDRRSSEGYDRILRLKHMRLQCQIFLVVMIDPASSRSIPVY